MYHVIPSRNLIVLLSVYACAFLVKIIQPSHVFVNNNNNNNNNNNDDDIPMNFELFFGNTEILYYLNII